MARALDPAASAAGGRSVAASSNPPHNPHTPNIPRSPHTPSIEGSETVRHICPFCGNLNESAIGPCPRCTMENTPQTRKATKARIGPWYVLQSRNPAAPGMKFDTLVAFIRKGRIKPRSIVRGPTTHQLWKLATHVKGLSREFGVCYSCGGSIEKTAKVCPRCNRLQEPPANPDALLEGEEAVASAPAPTIHREIRKSSPDADIVIPPLGAPRGQSAAPAPHVAISPEAVQPASLAMDDPAELPDEATRAFAVTKDAFDPQLNARDLADAFKLNLPANGAPLEPNDRFGRAPALLPGDAPAPYFVRRRTPMQKAAIVLLLAGLGVGAWLTYDADSRYKTVDWFNNTWAAIQNTGSRVGVTAEPQSSTAQPIVATPRAVEPEPEQVASVPALPATLRADQIEDSPPTEDDATIASTRIEAPKPAAVISADVTTKTAIDKGLKMWRQAHDELRDHPARAVELLEQIKQLPPEAWPKGLDLKIALAKKLASEAS